MFNAKRPSLEELPTSTQLRRSTIIAALSAIFILITVVLPAEYGIDPTGVGKKIGLTEMGEIKTQLAEEAEMDHQSMNIQQYQPSILQSLLGLFVSSAQAEESETWRDSVNFTLAPGETAEWKLVMTQGQSAEFNMLVEGGRVNFDLHGHGSGKSVTYKKGRGSSGSEGSFTAKFDGEHGWFWRNRDKQDVTVTLLLKGEYSALKGNN